MFTHSPEQPPLTENQQQFEQPPLTENQQQLPTLSTFLATEGYHSFQEVDGEAATEYKKLFSAESTTFATTSQVSQDGKEQRLLFATIPYSETITYILIHDLTKAETQKESANQNLVDLKDILFVDIKTGKSFSMRTVINEDDPLLIDNTLRFSSFGGSTIELAPVGQTQPPLEPVSRGMWNVYKTIEPLTILHEGRHNQQLREGLAMESGATAERDAWAFALTKLRELKKQGLNFLPDTSNQAILSHIELGLISYDLNGLFHGLDGRPYSRKTKEALKGQHSYFRYFKAIVKNIFSGIKKDPSLVTDTLLYKGRKKLDKITLTDLLKK